MLRNRRELGLGSRKNLTGFVAVAILIAAVALTSSAVAESAVIFYGGLNRAELGGDAELMGNGIAAGMQNELGGTWSSEKAQLGGLDLGAGYRLGLSPGFDLQVETQYVQRGTTFNLTGRNVPNFPQEVAVDLDVKLSYLEVMALVYVNPAPESPISVFAMAGPVLGIKTSAELKVSADGDSQSEELSSGVAGTSFGLLGAAGLSLRVSPTAKLSLQARYFLGQSELLENIDGTKATDLAFIAGLELTD